jgi:hydroxymethylpyrimidine pyrophosphatase-like HAD family hydrolase
MKETPLVIAIDFDGTIVNSQWPDLGDPKPNAVEVIRRLHDEGHRIIIWTCRGADDTKKAHDWLFKHGVPHQSINIQDRDIVENFKGDVRKILADVYIDDKQLGGIPDDWIDIYAMLQRHIQKLPHRVLDLKK